MPVTHFLFKKSAKTIFKSSMVDIPAISAATIKLPWAGERAKSWVMSGIKGWGPCFKE
jgi:hypothetical protein